MTSPLEHSSTDWLLRPKDRIFVAGHRGLVGGAICRRLQDAGFQNLIVRTKDELDLLRQEKVERFFSNEKPDVVILAAARVGGIIDNATRPGTFIYENLVIETNVIHAAYSTGVRQMLFLGSSCIYPKFAPQPIPESALLTGSLEESNAPYAIAKIAGLTMIDAYNRQYGTHFQSVMPCNLYGPGDSFDLERSHVLPALIRRFHEAKESAIKEVILWGTGTPRREFLYVDDLADACLHILRSVPETSTINIGSGEDLTIHDLANLVAEIVGYRGEIRFDPNKPDGTPRKLLDISRMTSLGWKPRISLREGIMHTYDWYRTHANA